MKVTLDTNVLISATFWKGDSYKIVDLGEKKTIEIVLSPDIIKEYIGVLDYVDIQNKIKVKNLDMLQSAAKLSSFCTIVQPKHRVLACEDEDDNRILECAQEGNVNFIVTNDKHLLKLKRFENIPVITPQELLAQIKY